METNLSALQGEVLALRCHLAALLDVLPRAVVVPFQSALEHRSSLVRDQLCDTAKTAFDREVISLSVTRRRVKLSEQGQQDQDASQQ